MCGISGSIRFDDAFDLYEKNLVRGSRASGLLVLSSKEPFIKIIKVDGIFVRNTIKYTYNLGVLDDDDSSYYLFHSQAPTNSTETAWSPSISHPFEYKDYYAAHNGIITNFSKLVAPDSNWKVDSSIIPYHLYHNAGDVKKTYNKYEGLLTSWIVTPSHQIYIVKAGSSLFLSKDKKSFSSCQLDDELDQVVLEGAIFKFDKNEGFKVDSTFNYTNPYFV